MPDAQGDRRILAILESCYRSIEAGSPPDLQVLCGGDRELIRRVDLLLARERELWSSQVDSQPAVRRALTSSVPCRLGDFTVLEPLGSGGMSRVFRARQESLGREVALKVLREELVATDTGRLRFQREASITAALDHPNIVPVYAAGEIDGVVFLAMKLLRGQPLDRLPKPLSSRAVAEFGFAICRALQSAHDIGVVHRDVKPQNIVVEAGVAYLVDFGLSSFAHSAGSITRPDSTPGTLMYLAPELARRQGAGLDPRVDVYGLGATLYEAVSGRPPFRGSSAIQLLHMIIHQDPQPLQLSGRDADLETIILRSMEKEPAKRFQTAVEMSEELERYLRGVPIRSRRISWFERSVRLVRRRPLAASLIGMVLLLCGTLSLMIWQQDLDLRQRIRRQTEQIGLAKASGDFLRAERALTELGELGVGSQRLAEIRSEVNFDRDVVLLTATLQSPIVHHDPRALARLVARIEAMPLLVQRSGWAEVALAFASRLQDQNPVTHRSLSNSVRLEWPRTAAALAAWSRSSSVAGELAGIAPGQSALDHVFSALAAKLAGDAPDDVEKELRLARAHGVDADAVQYSLAWSLESSGQLPTVESRVARMRAAYEIHFRLCESAAYSTLAEFQCAKLSIALHRPAAARDHLDRALEGLAARPYLDELVRLYELDVLGEIDPPRFWERWRVLESDLRHLPQFWLRAGYVRSSGGQAGESGEDSAWVRAAFDRGLAAGPAPAVRRALELALLQLDASVLFSATDPSGQPATKLWRELAHCAESFALQRSVGQAREMLLSDALSVASLAWFQAGHPERGWRVLEAAARDHGDPAVLSRYAAMVAERILAVHMAEATELTPYDPALPDSEAEHSAPLPEAASRALEWAVSVIDTQASMGGIDADALREARIGALACAFHLGVPTRSLPLAIAWQGAVADNDDDKVLQPLIDCCIADGGFRAEQWLPTTGAVTPRLATMLAESVATMRSLHERRELTGEQVTTALARWRRSGPVAATADETADPWLSLWRDIAALEAQVRAAK
ncbi:MAG: serine/threonine protein kinase [Planctomycetes bacterium]|jgi:serine/threonine protein kinase|nr:serine/threonine protein kinase [Planctomycetota bacterium]